MEMWAGVLSLLFGLLLPGVGARVVSVSPGPLIRVEGQTVSVNCDVHDYGGPDEQDFDWTRSEVANGPQVNIISTFDPSFSHVSVSRRVASGDISVVRLKDNRVELKIANAKADDAGFYRCRTPSTDSEIKGNYEADVQLIVIPHTLQVSVATPPSVVPEGSDITLSCNVTRELVQPTYLSVSWKLTKGGATEEVLTFGPQGGVDSGDKYTRRYADGGVRLVPGKNGSFHLVISRVTTSDDGTYECYGMEWTHESGGTWVKIVESRREMGTLTVTPTAQSLRVTASSSSSSSSSILVSPGDALSLLCSVAIDNLPALTLEVSWLVDGRDIITMERSGVVVSNDTDRGGTTLERASAGEFRLGVRGVGRADAGVYACRARAFIQTGGRSSGGGGGGRWHMAAEKTSRPLTVTVAHVKPSFTVTLDPILTPKAASEPTEVSCVVSNITHLPLGGRLGVTWQHTPLPGMGIDPMTPATIASLDAHGNLLPGTTYADRLQSGAIALSRVPPHTFKIRFLRTQEVDMGQLTCLVTVWTIVSPGNVEKTTEEKSLALTLRWNFRRPSLNVVASRVREASMGGATFEMSCSTSVENLGEAGYSVLVQSQDSVSSSVRTIMSLSPDNVVQHGGATEPSRRDHLVLLKFGPSEFRFRLSGVQLSDRGFYWCDITAWTKVNPGQTWTKATSAESNKVRVEFQESGPQFSVSIQSDASSVFPWETATMECLLSVSGTTSKTDDLAYEVQWFFTRLRGGASTTQVGGVDRFGVVTKNARNSSSDISIERKDTNTYVLNIHGTHHSDSGEYQCVVRPWFVSSSGLWAEAQTLSSSRMFLTVRFAVWDSLKMPLLYGAAASTGVCVLSLLLGLFCSHCFCRNTAHTPRSRNKLIAMEMD